MTEKNNIILDVKNLKLHFPIYKGVIRRLVGYVRAVDGVSFQSAGWRSSGSGGGIGLWQNDRRTHADSPLRPDRRRNLVQPARRPTHRSGKAQPAPDETAAPPDAHDFSGPVQFAQSAPDRPRHHRRAAGDSQRRARQGSRGACRRPDEISRSQSGLYAPLSRTSFPAVSVSVLASRARSRLTPA